MIYTNEDAKKIQELNDEIFKEKTYCRLSFWPGCTIDEAEAVMAARNNFMTAIDYVFPVTAEKAVLFGLSDNEIEELKDMKQEDVDYCLNSYYQFSVQDAKFWTEFSSILKEEDEKMHTASEKFGAESTAANAAWNSGCSRCGAYVVRRCMSDYNKAKEVWS